MKSFYTRNNNMIRLRKVIVELPANSLAAAREIVGQALEKFEVKGYSIIDKYPYLSGRKHDEEE